MPFEDEIPPYGDLVDLSQYFHDLTAAVIGAAIEVHRRLGPGLPETAYQRAMELELDVRHIPYERQKPVDVFYRGVIVANGKIDLLVDGRLIVEIKAVDSLIPLHRLQVRTYMRILKQPLGLLINFNVALLKQGIKRVIETEQNPS
jgi:GxxExxY protein